MTTTAVRRTLAQHIEDALISSATRIVTRAPDYQRPRLRHQLAAWVSETCTRPGRILVVPAIDAPRGRRIDTRTGHLVVMVRRPNGLDHVELCRVRLRDLELPPGIDAQAEVRTWLLQLGYGVPDDASSLTTPDPSQYPCDVCGEPAKHWTYDHDANPHPPTP